MLSGITARGPNSSQVADDSIDAPNTSRSTGGLTQDVLDVNQSVHALRLCQRGIQLIIRNPASADFNQRTLLSSSFLLSASFCNPDFTFDSHLSLAYTF